MKNRKLSFKATTEHYHKSHKWLPIVTNGLHVRVITSFHQGFSGIVPLSGIWNHQRQAQTQTQTSTQTDTNTVWKRQRIPRESGKKVEPQMVPKRSRHKTHEKNFTKTVKSLDLLLKWCEKSPNDPKVPPTGRKGEGEGFSDFLIFESESIVLGRGTKDMYFPRCSGAPGRADLANNATYCCCVGQTYMFRNTDGFSKKSKTSKFIGTQRSDAIPGSFSHLLPEAATFRVRLADLAGQGGIIN